MSDPLELPNTTVVISDDNRAMEFMRRLGVLQKLINPITLTDASAVFSKVVDHRTHWILCVRYSGFKRPEENGYQVLAWLKRDYPDEPMSKHITEWNQQPGIKAVVDLTATPKRN